MDVFFLLESKELKKMVVVAALKNIFRQIANFMLFWKGYEGYVVMRVMLHRWMHSLVSCQETYCNCFADLCEFTSCWNGGTCKVGHPSDHVVCECPPLYTGSKCEKRVSVEEGMYAFIM